VEPALESSCALEADADATFGLDVGIVNAAVAAVVDVAVDVVGEA
jgi:hypothetical protein